MPGYTYLLCTICLSACCRLQHHGIACCSLGREMCCCLSFFLMLCNRFLFDMLCKRLFFLIFCKFCKRPADLGSGRSNNPGAGASPAGCSRAATLCRPLLETLKPLRMRRTLTSLTLLLMMPLVRPLLPAVIICPIVRTLFSCSRLLYHISGFFFTAHAVSDHGSTL